VTANSPNHCQSTGVEIICLAGPEADLLEPHAIAQAIESANDDVVINAAAYTAVDKAESERA
jgi:dTDP-4-dehydrorhamnose reductase